MAFTLVELIVVLALIVVLIAILVPSMGTTRKYARKIICRTHLKQQAVAFHAYANSNRNAYPPPVRRTNWAFGGLGTDATMTHSAGPARLWETGYATEVDLFFCPSTSDGAGIVRDVHWRPKDPPAKPDWKSCFVAYQYLGPYVPPSWLTPSMPVKGRAADARAGSTDLLMTDLAVDDFMWWRSNHLDRNGEVEGWNVLFNDGSVVWRSWEQRVFSWFHAREFYY